ncbi:hypothetical protein [Pleionea sp. CnH1-48]|uniref:hypothetical protein n=1 Tax=Pleionea sp. CnH1-48 TaxID=2954494 RepID=UPI0020981BB8|nr:hypothetical protein [Pleionea sp. CnH1-48]MCO7226432.1 hypothetical protein [Pleionea sp. CnH1-48]
MSNDGYDKKPTLEQAVAALSDEVEPSRNLWPGIESRLQTPIERQPYTGSRWMPHAVAASLVVAVSSLAFSVFTWQHAQAINSEQVALLEQNMEIRLLEQRHRLMRANFQQKLDEYADSMDSAVVADIRNSLFVIDEALEDLRVAMAKEPENPRLAKLLVETYRQQQLVIQQVPFRDRSI